MLNLIIQTVTDATPDRKVEFKRNVEKSAEFAPVFDVIVNDLPIGIFNSAIINSLDKPLAEIANTLITSLTAQIRTQSLPL